MAGHIDNHDSRDDDASMIWIAEIVDRTPEQLEELEPLIPDIGEEILKPGMVTYRRVPAAEYEEYIRGRKTVPLG